MKKKSNTFYIETLGCAKNSVDSRAMAEMLMHAGYQETSGTSDADVILVNTCGFIQPARQESLQVLRKHAQHKRRGQLLIAAGCLSERDKNLLLSQVHGLDAALGTRRWSDIVEVVSRLGDAQPLPYLHFPEGPGREHPAAISQTAAQGASAYLKIADGCDRLCAFCSIPLIKGSMVSRPPKAIMADARKLAAQGIREIILIAQDTSSYGRDMGMRDGLPVLLKELIHCIPQVPWLRIMYAFPGVISDALIGLMAEQEQILPYIDLPLQHADPNVLQRMRRPHDMDKVRELIRTLRERVPHLALRTTFIVGFPGETDQEFETLADFLRETRFDRAGFFPYYHEPGTHAYTGVDSVPQKVKQERLQHLAALQEEISLSINHRFVGQQLDVLIEGNGDGMSVGRSYRDAPEIDGLVLINEMIPPGQMIRARITGALVHDLIAEPLE